MGYGSIADALGMPGHSIAEALEKNGVPVLMILQ